MNAMLPTTRADLLAFLRRHWRALTMLLVGVLIPLILVADLTEDVFREGGFAWDQAILEWYKAHRTSTLTQVAEAMAVIGGVRVLPIITLGIAALLARAGARIHALFLVLAVAGATLLNVLAKLIFQRPRPDQLVAVLQEHGFSFPSGHSMANAAFGVALGLVFWKSRAGWPIAILGVLWAVAIGASRNYLGVHYPTDVLVGFLSSTAWVYGLNFVMSRRWPGLRKSPGGVRDTLKVA